MSPQIVFKQSTRARERKLNFESVNQHSLSSLSTSNHRWLDQAALPGLWALHMQRASTQAPRTPVGCCCGCCCCGCGCGCCCYTNLNHLGKIVTQTSRFSLFSALDGQSLCVITSQRVCLLHLASRVFAGWRRRTLSTDQFCQLPCSSINFPSQRDPLFLLCSLATSLFPLPLSHQFISLSI